MRKILSIALLFTTTLFVGSCSADLVEELLPCDFCDPSTPWSKREADSCYPTKADCEVAEGKGCIICS